MKMPLSDCFYFRLSYDLKRDLIQLSKMTDKSISQLIRQSVEEMLERFHDDSL